MNSINTQLEINITSYVLLKENVPNWAMVIMAKTFIKTCASLSMCLLSYKERMGVSAWTEADTIL